MTELENKETKIITPSRLRIKTQCAGVLKGINEFMEIAEIQMELEERGLQIPSIGKMHRKQNGEKVYLPLVFASL